MCTQVYIGADRPLPTIPYNPDALAFYVLTVPPPGNRSRDVEFPWRWLKTAYAYYVGSHAGCGCGLDYLEPRPSEPLTEWNLQCRESTLQLAAYLSNVTTGGPVKLLGHWLGKESKAPLHERTETPDYFSGTEVWLRSLDGELITVVPGTSS